MARLELGIEKVENMDKVVRTVKYIALFLFIFILLIGSFYTISAGYRGVVLTMGKPSDLVSGEGFHMKIPLVQKVIKIEVRTQKIEVVADSASKDLQDVQTTIALNFHISPNAANKLYQEVGLSYSDRIISPAIQESVKAVTAKFVAEELITKRPEVRILIQDVLRGKLLKYNILVDDFNIVNFQFSEEFDKAIESKVTAEQLKLKAERDLERIEVEARQVETAAIGEKKAAIAAAQGQAESIRIIEEQLKKSPRYIDYLKVKQWNGILPLVTGGGIPLIDLDIQNTGGE